MQYKRLSNDFICVLSKPKFYISLCSLLLSQCMMTWLTAVSSLSWQTRLLHDTASHITNYCPFLCTQRVSRTHSHDLALFLPLNVIGRTTSCAIALGLSIFNLLTPNCLDFMIPSPPEISLIVDPFLGNSVPMRTLCSKWPHCDGG
jgi:hypothetical protein